jgi:hypothetical protein
MMKRIAFAGLFLCFGAAAFGANLYPRVEIAGGSVTVSGGLTDTELRATDVKVSLDSEVVATTEVSISTVGTPTTVSISTSAWTMVPAASTLATRNGINLSVPASLNAVVVGHLGDCTSTAIATTVRPLEFSKGSFYFIPVNNSICLWTLSLHTAAESIHVQEVKQ